MKVVLILLCFGPLAWSGQTSPQTLLAIQNYIVTDDLTAAENQLTAALKENPNDGGLYNLQGIIDAKRNQLDRAENDFTKALRLRPDLAGAYLNLARVYELRNERTSESVQRAISLYREFLKRQPSSVEGRLGLAKVLEWKGEFLLSLGELGRLPAGQREQPLALALRCADLSGLGRLEEASKAAEALVRTPEVTEDDIDLVIPILKERHADSLMIQLLEMWQQNHAPSSDLLWSLADAYTRLGQRGNARQVLEAIAQRGPTSTQPLLQLAHIAYDERKLEYALGYLAHARDLEPNNAAVHFFFGIVEIELDLPVDAKKSLARAIELDPSNAAYYYARGSVELQGKSAWDAIPYFQKYIALKPNDPRGHFALGAAQFASQDYESATKEMELVCRYKETVAGAEYFLGRIAKVNGDWKMAADHLQHSVEADPNYSESHAELGLVKLHLGDIPGAQRELARSLSLNPDSALANANLLALYQRTRDPRISDQQKKLAELDAKRSQKQELMTRTVGVRP